MEDFSKRLTRLKSQINGWCFICENYLEHKSLFTWAKNSFCHKLWTSQFILWFKLFIWLPAMATPASMGHCNDLYGLKRYFVRPCHLTLCAILCQFLYSYKLSLMFSTSKNSLGVKVVANSHSSPWTFFSHCCLCS